MAVVSANVASANSSRVVAAATAARRADRRWYLGAGAVLLVSIVIGASIGPAGPASWRVPLALIDHLPLISVDSGVTTAEWNIVWRIRMPRVILAALVGGMLSVAGASYQGVFRNPLVDPYLLGAAAGAGLGATIALTVGRGVTASWPIDPVVGAAFLASIATVAVTYVVGASFHGSGASGSLGGDPGAGGCRRRVLRDRRADLHSAAQPGRRTRGVPVDPRTAVGCDVGRRPADRSVRDAQRHRADAAPPPPRRLPRRRRGGCLARGVGRPDPAGDRRRRHARHGRGRVGERLDRLRRAGRSARHSPDGGRRVPTVDPAVDAASVRRS